MRKLFTLLVLVCSAIAQGPPDFRGARYDLEVAPALTLPTNIAVGATITDPFFPNAVITVCAGSAYHTADSGAAVDFSLDDGFLALTIAGAGSTQVFNFDATTGQCTLVPGASFPTVQRSFSRVTANRLYTQEGTKLYQTDLGPTGILAKTLLFDYASSGCLGVGYKDLWRGVMSISWDDGTFPMAFSTGAQESGHVIAVWKPGLGCRILDTKTGLVSGQWGPSGTITTANRLLMHESAGALDGIHVRYEAGTCLVGKCVPELWNVYSLEVDDCGAAPQCQGHSANGFTYQVNGNGEGNWYSRAMTARDYTVSPPFLIPPSLTPPGLVDQQHTTWSNDVNDQQPFFAMYAGSDNGMGKPFKAAWDGEIIGVSMPAVSGFAIPFREFHTFSSGVNCNANVTPAQSSQTGKFVVWTTDFGTPNCYVVVGKTY